MPNISFILHWLVMPPQRTKNTEMTENCQKSANFPPFLCFFGPCGSITNQCTMKLIFGIKASFMVTRNILYSACQKSKKDFFWTTLMPLHDVVIHSQVLIHSHIAIQFEAKRVEHVKSTGLLTRSKIKWKSNQLCTGKPRNRTMHELRWS